MPTEWNLLLHQFGKNPPATQGAISNAEKALTAVLPADYVSFLQSMNGGEGPIGGDAYAMFWQVEQLAEMNEGYEVNEYAPGLVLIGSDGAGEAFAFDMRQSPPSVVSVPFVGMDLEYAETVGENFTEFLQKLSQT
jgi:cell wall assembly regulator SMI1